MKSPHLLFILTIILSTGLIVSCEDTAKTEGERWYPPKKTEVEAAKPLKKQDLWGHWVCTDFVNLVKARRTVRGVRNRPMFLEVVFKPEFGDSALLVTGHNNLLVPYEKRGNDSIIIKNIRAKKNLVLLASKGLQRLDLPDSLIGEEEGQLHTWTFTKTSAIKPLKTSDIEEHINTGVLKGTYTNSEGETLLLKKDGSINGWSEYNKYTICKGGDCFMLTRSPLDIVTLSKGNNKEHYAFWIKSNDSLYFYRLKKMSEDSYYNYQPQEVAFAFKKTQ